MRWARRRRCPLGHVIHIDLRRSPSQQLQEVGYRIGRCPTSHSTLSSCHSGYADHVGRTQTPCSRSAKSHRRCVHRGGSRSPGYLLADTPCTAPVPVVLAFHHHVTKLSGGVGLYIASVYYSMSWVMAVKHVDGYSYEQHRYEMGTSVRYVVRESQDGG